MLGLLDMIRFKPSSDMIEKLCATEFQAIELTNLFIFLL